MAKLFAAENQRSYADEAKGIAWFLAAICIVFVADRVLPLEQLGLVPRSLRGLSGVISMPFLHADFAHLLSNLIPLTVLLILLTGSQAHSARVVVLTTLASGVLLWAFGRTALHIGASGLVFGLCAFLIAAGALERRATSIAVATLVILLYGSTMLSGILPTQQGVSWDGHALGVVGGLGVAATMFLDKNNSAKR
ncbi:MAG: rhomboid family intramembrane serine protease [Granulosicoccaceae bacterium]